MNIWIDSKRDSLLAAIERVDMVIINDAEARQLADQPNLVKAARQVSRAGRARDRQARRVRRGTLHAADLLRDSGLPARIGLRSDGRGRHLRRRLHGLPGEPGEIGRGGDAARDDLRLRDGLLQRRRVRDRSARSRSRPRTSSCPSPPAAGEPSRTNGWVAVSPGATSSSDHDGWSECATSLVCGV